MKKFGKLLKKYGFFAATGTICIGALVAIFMMPNHNGDVSKEPNAYAKNMTADSQGITDSEQSDKITILDEDDLDTTDQMVTNDNDNLVTNESATAKPEDNTSDNQDTETDKKDTTNNAIVDNQEIANDTTSDNQDAATQNKVVADATENMTDAAKVEDAITSETFESTTVSTEEPFFADGDTFAWPVEGSVVVPYTDESTKHWFSETLNQTMRTFGICISADEGTEVKAVAKGTVIAADEDSTKLVSENMPNVGSLMVIDHGNGYMSYYGFQNGTMNMDLVGQVVNTGDVLGVVGGPKGAFTSLGDNLYLQVVHNGEVVNPLNYLADQTVKTDGVDMGFAES